MSYSLYPLSSYKSIIGDCTFPVNPEPVYKSCIDDRVFPIYTVSFYEIISKKEVTPNILNMFSPAQYQRTK